MRLVATYSFEPSDDMFNTNLIKEITDVHHTGAIDEKLGGSTCWQSATWKPGVDPNTIDVTATVTSVDKFLGVDGYLNYAVWTKDHGGHRGEFVNYRLLRVVINDP